MWHLCQKLAVLAQFPMNIALFQLFMSCLKFLSALWLSILMHMMKLAIFLPVYNLAFMRILDTCDALWTITSAVQKFLDIVCEVCMIGLDFSAAFDCVNHEALIFKLRQMDIDGTSLSIIIDFFFVRKKTEGGC